MCEKPKQNWNVRDNMLVGRAPMWILSIFYIRVSHTFQLLLFSCYRINISKNGLAKLKLRYEIRYRAQANPHHSIHSNYKRQYTAAAATANSNFALTECALNEWANNNQDKMCRRQKYFFINFIGNLHALQLKMSWIYAIHILFFICSYNFKNEPNLVVSSLIVLNQYITEFPLGT